MQVGYVMLQTPELAQTVVRRLEETPRHSGRDIRVAPFRINVDTESSQDGAVFFKFKSKSMKPRITEEVIRAHLEPAFGPLQSLCIKAHYWKPKMKGQDGYGFLSFETEAANERATSTADRTKIGFVSYAFGSIKHTLPHEERARSLSPSSLGSTEAQFVAGRQPKQAVPPMQRTASPSSTYGSFHPPPPPPTSSGSFYHVQPPPPMVSPSPSPPPHFQQPMAPLYPWPPSSTSEGEVVCQQLPDGSYQWVRVRVIGPAVPVYGGRFSPPSLPHPDDTKPTRLAAASMGDHQAPTYAPPTIQAPFPSPMQHSLHPPTPSPFDGHQPHPPHDAHFHAALAQHPLHSASQHPPAPQMFVMYPDPHPMCMYYPSMVPSPACLPPGPPGPFATLPPQQQAPSSYYSSPDGHSHR
eukprot:gene13043-9337_t